MIVCLIWYGQKEYFKYIVVNQKIYLFFKKKNVYQYIIVNKWKDIYPYDRKMCILTEKSVSVYYYKSEDNQFLWT